MFRFLYLAAFVQGTLFANVKESNSFRAEKIVEYPDVIWSMEFPEPTVILFTTRGGKLISYDMNSKKILEIKDVPQVVVQGQGGLLDLALHPNFKQNNVLYLSFSKATTKGKSTTALFRGRLKGDRIIEGKTIFEAVASSDNSIHYGSRIAFDQNGKLFLTVGDRNERSITQNLDNHYGKILRLNDYGEPASDNPFADEGPPKNAIWTYGHRNPQGLAIHPATKDVYENEFGPRGGDELNIIEKSLNYGWPIVSYGREYWGPKISSKPTKKGLVDPVAYYTPSISPSGMDFYSGDKIPQWKNDLFIGTLSGLHLRRLRIENKKVTEQEVLLKSEGYRIRDVKSAPDGYLYISTDSGVIARVVAR